MSSFNPINVSDNELDVEEHTREMQIEHAHEVFDDALKAQKAKKFTEADSLYHDLFQIEIIHSKNETMNPTIEQLKYLAHRNRGFFRLEQLFSQDPESNDTSIIESRYDKLLAVMEDFVDAIEHNDPDLKLLELVCEIFSFYGQERLARLGFEYKLIQSEDDDLAWNLAKPQTLLPNQVYLLDRFKATLERLHDEPSVYTKVAGILSKKRFSDVLTSRKSRSLDFHRIVPLDQFHDLHRSHNDLIEVPVGYRENLVDLDTLLQQINGILPKPKGRSKVYDNYILTQVPIDRITFRLDEQRPPEVAQVESVGSVGTGSDAPVDGESKNTATPKPGDLTPAQRIARNRASRTADTDTPDVGTILEEQTSFLESFDHYIKLCGVDATIGDLTKVALQKDVDVDSRISEFQSSLDEWDSPQTEALLVKLGDEKGKSVHLEASIKEILNASSDSKVMSNEKVLLVELDNGKLLELVRHLNENSYHLEQIRWQILNHLFSFTGDQGGTLITEGSISSEAYDDIKSIIDAMDVMLYHQIYQSLVASGSASKTQFNMATSILEILIDSYLSLENEMRTKNMHRALLLEQEALKRVLISRINNWTGLLEDAFSLYCDLSTELSQINLRFQWAKVAFLQHQPDFNTKTIAVLFEDMSEKACHIDIDVVMINYDFLPRLKQSNIDIQLSKLKILETFTTDEQSNQILENILLKDTSTSPIENDMKQLLKRSSVDLKLRLWSVLLAHYESENKIDAYKVGFHYALKAMATEIQTSNLPKGSFQRSQVLLRATGFFGVMAERYANFLAKNSWELPHSDDDVEILQCLMPFFELIYTFLLHEDAAALGDGSLKDKSVKSYERLQSISVLVFLMVSIYYDLTLKERAPETLNDFYSVLHVQLGLRHICNDSHGVYLEFVLKKLADQLWEGSDIDFCQIIYCRYGLSLSMKDYEPFDHHCVEQQKMSPADALQVARYLVPYCYRNKHPLLNTPRADVKAVLDAAYEGLGDLDTSIKSVETNLATLNNFLNTDTIDLNLFKSAFNGKMKVSFEPLDAKSSTVASTGLYFMQGLTALHLFRIRKRAMQGRSAELDFVIKMFANDLAAGSGRFESWLLLGQAYSYLVEDDIIWTSDKLNSEEKKASTANTQRQSLMCYLMSISLYSKKTSSEKEALKQIGAMIWNLLGRELYNSWMKPMDGLMFEIASPSSSTRLASPFGSDTTSHAVIKSSRQFGDRTMYKLLVLVFKEVLKFDPQDWYSYMYLAKAQLKLKDDKLKENILSNLSKSCELSLLNSSKDDPVVEPHYLLCSVLHKFVVGGLSSIDTAYPLLLQDSVFAGLLPEKVTDLVEFSKALNICLEKCLSYDRKKWQHKPRFRLADIKVHQLDDLPGAIEEMDSIINLKPNVRSLSMIWKPEFERPGKHFVYNYIYINFYVELMDMSADVYSLIQLVKKLRKLGSSMIKQVRTFDAAVSKTCTMIKKIVGIKPGYLDNVIGRVVYPEFVAHSKKFIAEYATKTEVSDGDKLTLYFLSEVSGFRRMANGFSATGVIDDCYHSLYMWLFMPYLEGQLNSGESSYEFVQPGGQMKPLEFVTATSGNPSAVSREKIRVARRDITPYCVQLLGSSQSVVEERRMAFSKGSDLGYDRQSVLSNHDYENIAVSSKVDWADSNYRMTVGSEEEALKLNELITEFEMKEYGQVDKLDLVKMVPKPASIKPSTPPVALPAEASFYEDARSSPAEPAEPPLKKPKLEDQTSS